MSRLLMNFSHMLPFNLKDLFARLVMAPSLIARKRMIIIKLATIDFRIESSPIHKAV